MITTDYSEFVPGDYTWNDDAFTFRFFSLEVLPIDALTDDGGAIAGGGDGGAIWPEASYADESSAEQPGGIVSDVTELIATEPGQTVTGTEGPDYMWSQAGGSVLSGGAGLDTLISSGGDTLIGGAGADCFIFDMTARNRGLSHIADLSGDDVLIVFSDHGLDVIFADALPHLDILHEPVRFSIDGNTILYDGRPMATFGGGLL